MAWKRGDPLVAVYSCFGGLGVYRMEAVLGARYSGEDCEHVTFHRSMREQGFGRMFLNPHQITLHGCRPTTVNRVLNTRLFPRGAFRKAA
jgi:hypothetical protein